MGSMLPKFCCGVIPCRKGPFIEPNLCCRCGRAEVKRSYITCKACDWFLCQLCINRLIYFSQEGWCLREKQNSISQPLMQSL